MIQGILKKVFKARDKLGARRDDNPEEEKPFLEHLDDLRVMIIRVVSTLIISLLLCFIFNGVLIEIIRAPLGFVDVPAMSDGELVLEDGKEVFKTLGESMGDMPSINPVGTFMLAIKVSFLAAITVSFPFLVFFLLQFILPGLRETEKKILWPAMAVGFGLFLMGVLFAYFVVVPRAMQFFYMFSVERGLTPMWTIELYSKFAVRFILIFGICFELPVLVMALVKLDILNYTFMSKRRGAAIVILFFVAALITPTHDALTLALLGAPMYILYEICIWMSYFMEKKDRKLNPELYEARERIETELAAEADKPMQWGGFGGGDEDDDDHHHDDYDHDEHHDEDWHDPHHDDPHADDPYHQGHDDYHDNLHDPDHDSLEDDPDHGGGTRLDAGSHGSDEPDEIDHTGLKDDPNVSDDASSEHAGEDLHADIDHDDIDEHHDEIDEIDEYHRHVAEAEAAEQAALEAEAKQESGADATEDSHEAVSEPGEDATLEEFSARDEATTESESPSEVPSGAALGDTTGLGDSPAKAERSLESRIHDLEDLVKRMADRINALENGEEKE